MSVKNRYIYITVLAFLLAFVPLGAQSVRHITVEQGKPYVENVSLVEGEKDKDLLVKVIFDEPNNTLAVSLISYRQLFVFQNDVRYSTFVSGRKFRHERLPYVVVSDIDTKYEFTRSFCRNIRPVRKHIFRRWIEAGGLQPQPRVDKMVNEFIEQRFDILNRKTDVSVRLQDVLLMEENGRSRKKTYEFVHLADLDRTYDITIKRNPCFGKDDEIKEARDQTEALKKSYLSFDEKFGEKSGKPVDAKVKLFSEMKTMILEQFPRKTEKSPCPLIQAEFDRYNAYADSVSRMEYKVEEPPAIILELDLSAEYISQMARQIDNHVGRWMLTDDEVEKKDLVQACDEIVQQVNAHIEHAEKMSQEQKSAVYLLRKAEKFYKKTCIPADR